MINEALNCYDCKILYFQTKLVDFDNWFWNYSREKEVGYGTLVTLSRLQHGGLTHGVMADKGKALTHTIYFVHPTAIQNINP